MQELFKNYGPYIFDVLIFVMVFAWCFCGSGGTRDAKTKKARYGIPTAVALAVVLVIHGLGRFDAYLEKGTCDDLPPGTGVMIHDKCYKQIDGSGYVPVNTTVYRKDGEHG